MKKILITGASGFVGGYLVSEALSRDYTVHVGVRKTSNRDYLQDPRIQFLILDFKNPDQLKKDLKRERFDFIIHNAGITKAKNLNAYLEVNRDYLEVFVSSLMEKNVIPQKFIYVSSLAAIGPGDLQPENIVNENSKPHPVTHYGESKLAGERYLESTIDFPYVTIRPTAVYGPREKDLLTVFKAINKGLDIRIGFKEQKLSFIYVKDLARLMLDVLESKKERKAYLVSDGKVYSGEELNEYIKASLNKKAVKIKIPVSILTAMAAISGGIANLRGKSTILNLNKVNEIKCQSWAIDTSGITKDFNFAPSYYLKEGIKRTADWYKKNNWL